MKVDDDYDPYAVPSASLAADHPEPNEAAESVRRRYLLRERLIKMLGESAIVEAILVALLAVATMLTLRSQMHWNAYVKYYYDMAIFIPGFFDIIGWGMVSFVLFALGLGLTRLRTWARWVWGIAAILGALSLIPLALFLPFLELHIRMGMTIAAGVSGAIAFLFFSPTGSFLFTDEYRAIVAETPWIKPLSIRLKPKR